MSCVQVHVTNKSQVYKYVFKSLPYIFECISLSLYIEPYIIIVFKL